MTGAAQLTRAVSAARRARATPNSLPGPASLTFHIYEDNGGGYHWAIVADDGQPVRSSGFKSYEEAEHAAGIVQRGASRASWQARAGEPAPVELPPDSDALATARDCSLAPTRHDPDTERWLDEGGSLPIEVAPR